MLIAKPHVSIKDLRNEDTSLIRTLPVVQAMWLERSIRELQDVKVIYEPHQKAYYYGPERKADSNYPTISELDPAATFQAADEKFLQPYEGYRAMRCIH